MQFLDLYTHNNMCNSHTIYKVITLTLIQTIKVSLIKGHRTNKMNSKSDEPGFMSVRVGLEVPILKLDNLYFFKI